MTTHDDRRVTTDGSRTVTADGGRSLALEVADLTHQYDTERALNSVSFGVEPGELVALLGPSGCGKTTLVQAIAGHIDPTAGRVRLRGDDVTDAPPESRHVGLVFQQSTLYPHMTVGENVAYGLTACGTEWARRDGRVAEYLDLVDLRAQADESPEALSGGQRRRVELARALAPEPDVLLLDEPLSALDRTLRDRLRDEIDRIQRETDVATLFVTHDQADAMALADRLVVLDGGSISAVGEPRALYESPPTPFLASFLGRSNRLRARVVDADSSADAAADEPRDICLDNRTIDRCENRARFQPGDTVVCHVRPEVLTLQVDPDGSDATSEPTDTDGPPRSITLSGTVRRVRDVGTRYDVTVRTAEGATLTAEQATDPPAVGDAVTVRFPPSALTVFPDDSVEDSGR